MNCPKILKAIPLENYQIKILFDNNITKIYNFEENFKYDFFLPLKDYNLFKALKVDISGHGISWNDDLDLSEFELWNNSIEES